ncbi:hypothetical protein MNBD_ALPHA04-1670 [hydrothermal vent metagenome]|uniref:JAB1/MPN/MOV34 metalloenzyme domain-containing protein n=1 Tax=hydrothermal vent metagenome TaxID=652676 RepID=A0A3B0RQF7_9ZZZZ
MKLTISSAILEELQRQARHGVPLEICGLLFGHGRKITSFQQTRNVAKQASRHFEIDPAALIAAERGAREGGPKIIGYYHSHPSGEVKPSETDAKNAASDNRFWLLLNGREASAWQASKNPELFGPFTPITLDCR